MLRSPCPVALGAFAASPTSASTSPSSHPSHKTTQSEEKQEALQRVLLEGLLTEPPGSPVSTLAGGLAGGGAGRAMRVPGMRAAADRLVQRFGFTRAQVGAAPPGGNALSLLLAAHHGVFLPHPEAASVIVHGNHWLAHSWPTSTAPCPRYPWGRAGRCGGHARARGA
jgi:hypothetical protein